MKMDKSSWLLIMTPDQSAGDSEIKTLYHDRTRPEMVKMMTVFQDMNEHLILTLAKITSESTYENIIPMGDKEMFFMDSKNNWDNGKTYEDLQDDILEDRVMESLINGDMGIA
jgi:hypothetical protein